jgi:hypothetical protein
MEKMEIFLSWHGQRGHAVAAALEEWLPQIANAFKPWLSSGIQKGSRWRSDVATRLEKSRAGIICLTPSALTAPWLLFEAGAIAKPSETTYACTLLVDLKSEDVPDPLAQFMHTQARKKDDVLKLVRDLNSALESAQMPAAHIEKAFEKWWPDLENKLQNLPPDESTRTPHRSERELLVELVGVSRQTSLSVLESNREIMEEFKRLESRQAYLATMIAPSDLPRWYGVAEALGGAGAGMSNKSTTTPPKRVIAGSLRNAARARAIGTTPEDEAKK